MHAIDGKTLVDLARGASGLTAPQTIDEAEAMLLQMAGPSFDTRTSQIKRKTRIASQVL